MRGSRSGTPRREAPVSELEGVFIPLTTPFRGDDVAADQLAANLHRWNDTPVRGYVVLGSSAEGPLLSEAERDRLLVAAREATPRGKLLVAGTGVDSTVHTVRQTR